MFVPTTTSYIHRRLATTPSHSLIHVTKMVVNKYIIVTLVTYMMLSKADSYPAAKDSSVAKDEKQDSLFGLPFLEFKNGGVRVNFGGYHAEAGLGGLLGQPGTSGGLYAGAGTPFGAHASADLGGFLNGQSKNGGGLNARAGLGNGGPAAAAGLGGNLDGSDPSKSGGQLYTATTNNGKTKITIKGLTPNQSNIQSIPKTNENNMNLSDNSDSEDETIVTNKKSDGVVRREVASIDDSLNVVDPALTTPIASGAPVYVNRRCRRKRVCPQTFRTTVSQQTIPNSEISANYNTPPLFHQQVVTHDGVGANTGYKDVSVVPGPAPAAGYGRQGTIFDDIFNIPISALKAVNQLLNNKAG